MCKTFKSETDTPYPYKFLYCSVANSVGEIQPIRDEKMISHTNYTANRDFTVNNHYPAGNLENKTHFTSIFVRKFRIDAKIKTY